MSTSDARKYHHGDLRQVLITTAIDATGEDAAGSASLREIARRAGVSHAAAYNHFTNKTDLLRAVAQQGFEALADELAVLVADPSTSIADISAGYVRFAMRHPVEFSLMFDRSLCLPAGQPDILTELGRRCEDVLRAYLARHYELSPGDAEAAGFAALSQMHGVATLILETPAVHVTSEAQAEALARSAAGHLSFARG